MRLRRCRTCGGVEGRHVNMCQDVYDENLAPLEPIVKKFDKLVRDNIPEIVTAEGNECFYVHPVSDIELSDYIKAKIIEESKEVTDARTRDEVLVELADLLEVMNKYAEQWAIKPYEVLIAMCEKERKVGKFNRNLILKEIKYKDE